MGVFLSVEQCQELRAKSVQHMCQEIREWANENVSYRSVAAETPAMAVLAEHSIEPPSERLYHPIKLWLTC